MIENTQFMSANEYLEKMHILQNKHILLGISGSISAYKMFDLVRRLKIEGAEIRVILTRGARAFVAPLPFEVFTGHRVYTDIFEFSSDYPTLHIDLANWADTLVISPATAHILAKLSQGLADDLLTSIALTLDKPILLCPSMNEKMYKKNIVQENIKRLKQLGFYLVEPVVGRLASYKVGTGRLPEIDDIIEVIKSIFMPKDLRGYKILVSAGPTREPIDPIRFLSNYSSGRMGFSLAKIAWLRGAEVTLVSGPTALKPPYGVHFISIETAEEMKEAIINQFSRVDAVIMAAAVTDFRPVYSEKKIKRQKGVVLNLEENPDILKELGKKKKGQVLIGFSAETGDVFLEASRKLKEKSLDLIVANDVTLPGAGFCVPTNRVTVISKDGVYEQWPVMSKEEVAMRLFDRIRELLRKRDAHN